MSMHNDVWAERPGMGVEDVRALEAETQLRRRALINLSIKRGLRWRLMLRVWLIVAFSLALAGVVFYYYSEVQVGNSYREFHLRAREFHDFLLPVLVSGLAASMLLGLVGALFFPQQLTGPLYRIEEDLKEIGKGDLTKRIGLRKGDEMTELAAVINAMVDDLGGMLRNVDDGMADLQRMLADASVDVGMKEREDLNALCVALQKQIGRFTF